MDSNLAMFMSVTGATPEVAAQYLEISSGNCELAIEMFLESGGNVASQNFVSPSDFSPAHSFRPVVEEPVRAPIPQRQDRILDPGMNPPGIFMQGRNKPTQIPKTAFEMAEPLPDDPQGLKLNRLAELFKAPTDLMCREPFDVVVEKAAEEKKWLMVNVIDITNFQSQAQNRDLWRDEMVKEIVRENFIFMQLGSLSEEGKRYLQLYPIFDYPHIGIIDPRTGERVVSWGDIFTPNTFSEKVTDFLDNWSLRSNKRSNKKRSMMEMSEEEQLQAALQASLESPPSPDSSNEASEDEEIISAPPAPRKDVIEAREHPEPDMKAPGVTRVQIRLKDGSRIARRILKTDKVRILFEHLKATIPDLQKPEAEDFDLVFVSKKLRECLDQLVEEVGIGNASLNLTDY